MTHWNFETILPADYDLFDAVEVERTIPQRFARMVEACGDRVAISDSGAELTYAALDRASGALAANLIEPFGTAAEPIALLYRAGAAYCIAQFGTLRAGKFFASLDWELPPNRLLPILEDLGVRLILCSGELESKALHLAREIPGCSVMNTESIRDTECIPPEPITTPESIAYVIYTSGSTGPPEGVMMSHRSVLHLVMNHTNSTHLRKEDRVLQVCPLSSAGSAGEVFPTLLNGGTLIPFELKTLGGRRLAEFLSNERVTILSVVPVVFRVLLASLTPGTTLSDVRLIRLTGDRILRRDCIGFAQHFSAKCLLRVSLGASEALLYTQYYVHHDHIPDSEIVPAGYPMKDMEVFVVDDDMNRLGPNETGEIAVKSHYLSSGYWRNPALTAERFLDTADGSKIYLTRDVGYTEPDGCFVHLGRKDARVKIYGKMVTITDIEAALMQIAGINEAVVVAVADTRAERFLVAYYVADVNDLPRADDIRRQLRAQFPTEILPRKIIRLEAFPLTERNKIDRRRLAVDLESFGVR